MTSAARLAAARLADALEQQGDIDGARTMYQRAISSGDADAAPNAGYNLGILLRQQGDLDGAQAAYRRALASGHPRHAPAAGRNLGNLNLRHRVGQSIEVAATEPVDMRANFPEGLLCRRNPDSAVGSLAS